MIRTVALAIIAFLSGSIAAAQEFPTRPIRVIVPYAAGGPSDIAARLLTNTLARNLKQTMIIENVGGAGGSIGSARAAGSEPDGYTLLFNNIALSTSPALYPGASYDPVNDLEPLGMSAVTACVLISRPDFAPAKMAALVEHIKASGTNVSFANSGPGGSSHLCQVLFLNAIGGAATSVAYRGSAPALSDVAAGRIDMMFDAAETAAPQIQAGRVKAYGITSIRRMSVLREVPTLDEQGLKGFDFTIWFGLFAPKKTPPAVVSRLSDAMRDAVQDPAYKQAVAKLGNEIPPDELSTPAALKRVLARDVERWRTLLRGVQVEQK